ncbi:MAG: MBL fold metallo-hydrolase [Chloroflexi bacterium]|nr:MBL fold metallo-hydrolase [Chloroflexota bacterium]
MPEFICATCGTQYPESPTPPEHCPICEDERQYVGAHGQQWTTLTALRANHRNIFREYEPNLVGIGTEPRFAIGQRALLIQAPGGNILWDCMTLLDEATIEAVTQLGGISAIAISHPHYYSSMVDWAHTFDVPIYLHTADRQHVMRPDSSISFWGGETKSLGEGITLINTGGHFEGATVLHWKQGAEGHGVLLSGDIVNVVQDRRYVSFMYSYPNQIPLPAKAIRRIVAALEPFEFERIYSAWWDTITPTHGKAAVAFSAERYIKAIEGTLYPS